MPDPISTSDHSPSTDTVAALLPLDADGPALVSEDGEVISHATLRKEVDRLAEQLRSAGLGPKDRLAIVLPNGPTMALVMLAAMTVGCAAPLNPKYREDEFRFYLDDLHASALLTLDGASSDAHAAAPEGTIPIVVRGHGMSIDLVTPQTTEGATRRLTSADRSLNVMPLFHIHGLMAGLLAPLSVGGSVICTTGFDAFKFHRWVDELRPSYYRAVPTMH